MQKIVFLDLEGTVIDELQKAGAAVLMNIAAVRQFLAGERPCAVKLFSFAFAGAESVALFRGALEAPLNQALGVTLDMRDAFTTGQLFQLCRKHGTVFESDEECMLFHSKDMGFQRFIELSPEFCNVEVVLVDDAVVSKTIHYPGRDVTIRMVNVNDLLQ